MEQYNAKFAEVYDIFMDNTDYDAWANYIISLLPTDFPKGARIFECGCGTGALTLFGSTKQGTMSPVRIFQGTCSKLPLKNPAGAGKKQNLYAWICAALNCIVPLTASLRHVTA